MISEKQWMISVAEKICIPAVEKAVNNLLLGRPYTIIDHVGFACTQLEELLRPLWGIAPLLEQKEYYITVDGVRRSVSEVFREVILEGCTETSPLCFSRDVTPPKAIGFANQMITEFSAYTLAIVLAPGALWEPYTPQQRQQVGQYVKKWAVTALKDSWPNNHYWFPMLAVTALEKMGIDCGDVSEDMALGFSQLDKMYLSHGWYQDGAPRKFDFYLAWSHHVYPVLWTYLSKGTRFDDPRRAQTYRDRIVQFFDYYTHMFDVDGSVPAFGRSLSYRFAQSAFFTAAAFGDCAVDYGLARRILVKNISYFMDNMVLDEPVLPPGYLYSAPALVENYTSSGGSYWCAKTFLALHLPDDHPLWTAPETPLPIERGTFLVHPVPDDIHMLLEGSPVSGVTLYNNTAVTYSPSTGYIGRFNDMGAYYSKFVYNSRSGFGISAADNVSCDNMISLETWDGTQTSRRMGYTDLGFQGNFLVSEHTPFTNDAGSRIRSYMLPLGQGFHVRAHTVTLSQPYKILQGGFSVGPWDDGSESDFGQSAWYTDGKGKFSLIHTVSQTPFRYCIKRHTPGLHLLAPQSGYPAYTTDVVEAGTYRLASVFYFGNHLPETLPQLTLEQNRLAVTFQNRQEQMLL
jgi:hypothetical protein